MSLLFPVHPLFGRGGAAPLNIADLFSTDLYTGNGSTQTITNGIDLAGEGGFLWLKRRDSISNNLVTSNPPWGTTPTHSLFTNTNGAQGGLSNRITFNSNGFSLNGFLDQNASSSTNVAWTFRRAPRFFDVVTYTGDGVAGRTISHNLGVAPGMIVIKNRSDTSNWQTYHRSLTSASYHIRLNQTDGEIGPSTAQWDGTPPTSSAFTVGTDFGINKSGDTYVAYLFAHDTASDGVIQCGSYTGNGSTTGPTINLGWEPQWVMIKRATGGSGDWYVWDSERGFSSPEQLLFPNDSRAEQSALAWLGSANGIDVTSTGFEIKYASAPINGNTDTHIYMAIRKEGV